MVPTLPGGCRRQLWSLICPSCRTSSKVAPKRWKIASSTLGIPRGGFNSDEPDVELSTLLKRAPEVLKKQCQLVARELKEKVWPEQRILEATPRHGELLVQWKFDKQETLDAFVVTSDSVRNAGFSQCSLQLTNRDTALFRGHLNTRLPKDGQVRRAGFAAISSKLIPKAFNRVERYKLWSLFTHLVLKVRGDGRTYLLNLGSPGYFDLVWHDVYNYPLHTHGGPYWQYAKIPFSKFYLSSHGRMQDRQSPIMGSRDQLLKENDVQYFGITMCDRIDGPFALEIDWIGVQYDATHFEDFAYELFEYPMNLE